MKGDIDLAALGPADWSDADNERPIGTSGANGTWGAHTPWGEADLTLVGSGRRPAPEFPLSILGRFWSAWVAAKADAASAPPDYVAVPLLACTGAALANVRWPVAGAGWAEPPVLWVAEVGAPSSGKSPGQDAAFDLLRHAEDRMGAGFEDERTRYATAKQVAEARRDEWKGEVKTALKSGHSAPDQPTDAVDPIPPVRPRVRVADATVEALGVLAASLPRGLLLVRDELTGVNRRATLTP